MRKKLPKLGDRRKKEWFALLPVTIDHERRWWERVTVEQEYKTMGHISEGGMLVPRDCWANVRFVG